MGSNGNFREKPPDIVTKQGLKHYLVADILEI
jgi:hypothetical protein